MSDPSSRTLLLLQRSKDGERGAQDELLPIVYAELRSIAARLISRERGEHLLQPTMIVHDAFLRLVGEDIDWESRKHFLCVSARAMRQLLRANARARDSEKRGGAWNRVTLVDVSGGAGIEFDIEALDEHLTALRDLFERQADVVELRFFANMTIEETAKTLGVSTGTVENDWRFARAWLLKRLGET